MWSDKHRETPVDIFVSEPFDFGVEYKAALVEHLSPRLPVRFVSLKALIKLKARANRPEDRIDIKHLTMMLKPERAKRRT